MHTTNYTDTFIAVAEDSPVKEAVVPEVKEEPSIAAMQFQLLHDHPYRYTSDDLLFTIHAMRKGLPKSEWKEARAQFFSKGQACMRTSPLSKRYGFGTHHDAQGRVALVALGSKAYDSFSKDKKLAQVKAMRSKRP